MSLGASNYFTVVLQKRAIGNTERLWANTYKVFFPDAPGDGFDWQGLLEDLAQAEAEVHTNVVEYVYGRVSTMQPDSVPYDPTVFVTHDLDGITGNRVPTTEVLYRNVVVNMRRQVELGRQGKLAFRGALQEGELAGNNALMPALTPAATATFDALAAAMYSDMGESLDNMIPGGRMVLGPGNLPTDPPRTVTGFAVRGVGTLPYKHRWFNRVPA